MMGGNIKVKSELGKGSEITIGLRFKTTSATKNRGVIQELNGFRALVADDNMDSCVSVEKMLRTIGLRPGRLPERRQFSGQNMLLSRMIRSMYTLLTG